MIDQSNVKRRRGPVALTEIVGRVLGPVTARRGFATADLIAAWPEIVGVRFADVTQPQRIAWPRGKDASAGAVLHLKVDGPQAILVQHELGQIIERVNAFLGYAAVAKVRLFQGPVAAPQLAAAPEATIDAQAVARLHGTISAVESDALRDALDRLGRGVLAQR